MERLRSFRVPHSVLETQELIRAPISNSAKRRSLRKKKAARSRQLSFAIPTHGGRRPGAGRPNRTGQVNHMARPDFKKEEPLHITIKLRKGLNGLRMRTSHRLFQQCARGMREYGAHVVHYSIQSNHVHLLVEAQNKNALAAAMKSFGCRFAKGLKRLFNIRSLHILNGRYHMRVLKTPSEVKNALRYIFFNFSKHARLIRHIDPYSSGVYFPHWKKLIGNDVNEILLHQLKSQSYSKWPDYLAPPRTWLLKTGWQKIARALHNCGG